MRGSQAKLKATPASHLHSEGMDAEGVRRSRKSRHPAGCGSACLLLKIWGLELLFSLTLWFRRASGGSPRVFAARVLVYLGGSLFLLGRKHRHPWTHPACRWGHQKAAIRPVSVLGVRERTSENYLIWGLKIIFMVLISAALFRKGLERNASHCRDSSMAGNHNPISTKSTEYSQVD